MIDEFRETLKEVLAKSPSAIETNESYEALAKLLAHEISQNLTDQQVARVYLAFMAVREETMDHVTYTSADKL